MRDTLGNLPALEGWVTLAQAAEMLGFTRQHAWRKARLANEGLKGGWKTVHRVGDKAAYVVSLDEVLGLMINFDQTRDTPE